MSEIAWDDIEHGIQCGRPMRFSGSDSEIARNFFLAWVLLREKIETGGLQGIDYSKLVMPSAPSPGGGFGGWLGGAYAVVDELERIALGVVRNVDPERVRTWVQMRRPDNRKSSKALAKTSGRSERAHRLDAEFMDRCLVGALRVRNYVVSGYE